MRCQKTLKSHFDFTQKEMAQTSKNAKMRYVRLSGKKLTFFREINILPLKSLSLINKWKSQTNCKIQGDPNQNLLLQLAITLKICISDPMLVKPKWVLEAYIYFDFSAVCLQFLAVCLQF